MHGWAKEGPGTVEMVLRGKLLFQPTVLNIQTFKLDPVEPSCLSARPGKLKQRGFEPRTSCQPAGHSSSRPGMLPWLSRPQLTVTHTHKSLLLWWKRECPIICKMQKAMGMNGQRRPTEGEKGLGWRLPHTGMHEHA